MSDLVTCRRGAPNSFSFEWQASGTRVLVVDAHCDRCGTPVLHIHRRRLPADFDGAMIRALAAAARHEECGGSLLINTAPAPALEVLEAVRA